MSNTAVIGWPNTKPMSTPGDVFVGWLKEKITPVTVSLGKEQTFTHEDIQTFSFAPLDQIRKDLAEEGYTQSEIDREIEALSELPQYAKGKRNKGR